MLKHILLLIPVCVTIFWSIVLNTKPDTQSTPRLFLGKFMLFASVVYISHLLFFTPLPELYSYIDPFYQYASLMVYPLYHIYIRLLTVDLRFSFKIHARYLLVPTILFILYLFGILIAPVNDYNTWIYDRDFNPPSIHFLNIIYPLIRFTFLVQVIYTIIGNYFLIKKHGYKAKQFYSDIEDSSTGKVNILNILMIITGLASLALGALGRDFFANETSLIAIASATFTTMLFIVGWIGDKQKTLNPTFGLQTTTANQIIELEDLSSAVQKEILHKILNLFDEKKCYLHSKLSIQDLAQTVGTNRTYISTVINQNFNQNFCAFVNNYRVTELENVIRLHPGYSNQLLAEACGFGSVDSMKRAVKAKTGLLFSTWKEQNAPDNKKSVKNTRQFLQKT